MRDFIAETASKVGQSFRFRTLEGYGGVPIQMAESGERGAPAVIFIHGLAQSGMVWAHQMVSHQLRQFHVVIFDLRGHGASGKPWSVESYRRPETTAGDLARVRDEAGIDSFAAVAWSYGGHVLMDYIRQHGDGSVRKINLVGTLAAMVERPAVGATNPDQMKAAQANSVSDNPFEVVQANFGQADFVTNGAVDEEMQRLVELMANQLPAYVRKALTQSSVQNLDMPARIGCPVLLSVGSADWTVPRVSIDSLMAKLKDGRVSIYDDSGHAPFLEQSDRFNSELARFLESP